MTTISYIPYISAWDPCQTFGNKSKLYFWSQNNTAYPQNITIHTVKHGVGSIIIWGYFSIASSPSSMPMTQCSNPSRKRNSFKRRWSSFEMTQSATWSKSWWKPGKWFEKGCAQRDIMAFDRSGALLANKHGKKLSNQVGRLMDKKEWYNTRKACISTILLKGCA